MKDKEFGYAMKALRMVIRREWHRMTSRRSIPRRLRRATLTLSVLHGHHLWKRTDGEHSRGYRRPGQHCHFAQYLPTHLCRPHLPCDGALHRRSRRRRALQQKDIYGYLVIPPRFEQKAVTGTGATLTYYYHYALLSVGSELMAASRIRLPPWRSRPS